MIGFGLSSSFSFCFGGERRGDPTVNFRKGHAKGGCRLAIVCGVLWGEANAHIIFIVGAAHSLTRRTCGVDSQVGKPT